MEEEREKRGERTREGNEGREADKERMGAGKGDDDREERQGKRVERWRRKGKSSEGRKG